MIKEKKPSPNSVYDEIAGFQVKRMSFFTKFVFGSRKYSAPFSATSHTRETLAEINPVVAEKILVLNTNNRYIATKKSWQKTLLYYSEITLTTS